MKKNVIFIKVQKCSSTTVRYLIEKFADSHNLKKILMKKDTGGAWHRTADYDTTHLWSTNNPPYNISARHHAYDETYFNNLIEDPIYITFIRHPLERAMSAYYSNDIRPHAHERNVTFEDWWYKNLNFLDKSPVRLSLHAEIINNFMGYMLGFDTINEVNEKSLTQRYSFIGLTERFNESIEKMEEILEWSFNTKKYPHIRQGKPNIVKKNITKLSPKFLKDFEGKNKIDYEIYNISKKILDEK